jgi:hypothetical protein
VIYQMIHSTQVELAVARLPRPQQFLCTPTRGKAQCL